MSNTLTCVYCGMAYPEGTPPHGNQILTDHIKICEKHPLRQAEVKITKLRKALISLVGAETKEELEGMEIEIKKLQANQFAGPMPDNDRAAMVNAIHALMEL